MGNDTRALPQGAIDAISARLAALPDLRLPAQLRSGASEQRKREYLGTLLLHDPGVFLERHGGSLAAGERVHFQPLRGDYEVDFWLRALEDGEDEQKRGAAARNRRLAYMNRLEKDGQYFSEKEMRDRQPGLYHQYVGQYRPPEVPQGPGDGCQAGSILAESIMRQQEELVMRERAEAEAKQWGQAEAGGAAAREVKEEEEEEESGSEEERGRGLRGTGDGLQQAQRGGAADPANTQQQQQQQQQGLWGSMAGAATGAGATAPPETNRTGGDGQGGSSGGDGQGGSDSRAGGSGPARGQRQQQQERGGGPPTEGPSSEKGPSEEEGPASKGVPPSFVHISPEEQSEYAAAFLDIMKSRFLAGQDTGVDYGAIDADAELDEDWADQQRRDAEDDYFDQSDDEA